MERRKAMLAAIASAVIALSPGVAMPMQQEPPLPPKPTAPSDSTKVFVTKSGKKYHKKSCKHISGSASEITLGEAKKRGMSACSDCGGA